MGLSKKFPGYYPLNDKSKRAIWDKAHIFLDANVLLNLYRFSDSALSDVKQAFDYFNDRLFITDQIAIEYLRNRAETIYNQIKVYKDFKNSIIEIFENIESNNNSPFLSESIVESIKLLKESIINDLNEKSDDFNEYYNNDKIYEYIDKLFENKVISHLDDEKLENIKNEGKKRYEKKIPPGYKDELKNNGNQYGDLIIWKEMIKHAIDKKVDIIFVTNDSKEDWWWLTKDSKTLGIRPELFNEFNKETQNNIVIYSLDRFMQFYKLNSKSNIESKTILELKSLKDKDSFEDKNHQIILFSRELKKYEKELNNIELEIELLKNIKTDNLTKEYYVEREKRIQLLSAKLIEVKTNMMYLQNLIDESGTKLTQSLARLFRVNDIHDSTTDN